MRASAIIALWTLLSGPVLHAADWHTDYAAARAEALRDSKPLLLKFETSACLWCVRQDAELKRVDLSRLVLVRVTDPALAQQCGVESYPTMIFAAPDGKIVDMLCGFHDAEKVRATIRRARR